MKKNTTNLSPTPNIVNLNENHFEVRHHNIITTARYDYSACQIDIMFYMLSLLRPYDNHETVYKLHVREIENITGRKWNYQQLKEATENMGSKMFEVENDKSYKQIWMFQQVEYLKGMGCVEIRLSEAIRPYLFDLKNNFTSFELYSALKISSKFAKRIYTICSQWKDVGQTGFMEIDALKIMLKLKDPSGKEPDQFKQFSQFKEKVLDIAVKQINENTDLKLSYNLVKEGRAFKKIRFFIDLQKTSQLAIPFELSEDDIRSRTIVSNLTSIGIIKQDIVNQILTRQDEFFKWWYDYKTGRKNIKTSPSGLLLIEMGIISSKQKTNP